jgi:hypothetical protein
MTNFFTLITVLGLSLQASAANECRAHALIQSNKAFLEQQFGLPNKIAAVDLIVDSILKAHPEIPKMVEQMKIENKKYAEASAITEKFQNETLKNATSEDFNRYKAARAVQDSLDKSNTGQKLSPLLESIALQLPKSEFKTQFEETVANYYQFLGVGISFSFKISADQRMTFQRGGTTCGPSSIKPDTVQIIWAPVSRQYIVGTVDSARECGGDQLGLLAIEMSPNISTGNCNFESLVESYSLIPSSVK